MQGELLMKVAGPPLLIICLFISRTFVTDRTVVSIAVVMHSFFVVLVPLCAAASARRYAA